MGLLVTALKEESHFSLDFILDFLWDFCLDLNGIFGVVFVWIFHGIFRKSEVIHDKTQVGTEHQYFLI